MSHEDRQTSYGDDDTAATVVGTITNSSLLPGLFLQTPDGQAYLIEGLVAMSDGTVRWRK